jgi:hypothetical protein
VGRWADSAREATAMRGHCQEKPRAMSHQRAVHRGLSLIEELKPCARRFHKPSRSNVERTSAILTRGTKVRKNFPQSRAFAKQRNIPSNINIPTKGEMAKEGRKSGDEQKPWNLHTTSFGPNNPSRDAYCGCGKANRHCDACDVFPTFYPSVPCSNNTWRTHALYTLEYILKFSTRVTVYW